MSYRAMFAWSAGLEEVLHREFYLEISVVIPQILTVASWDLRRGRVRQVARR